MVSTVIANFMVAVCLLVLSGANGAPQGPSAGTPIPPVFGRPGLPPPPPPPGSFIPIIQQNFDTNPDGSYSFGYQSADGSNRQESGNVKYSNIPGVEPILSVQGSYSYVSPDDVTEDMAQKLILPLAERMVKKFMDEDKIEAEQEIQLYMMILEMRKNYAEALRILDGELGKKAIPFQLYSLKRIGYLKKLQKWYALNAYLKNLLLKEPDSYNYYVIYIDSVFQLIDDTSFSEPNGCASLTDNSIHKNYSENNYDEMYYTDEPDCSIEACVEFLNHCQKSNNKLKHRLRGPYLAHLLLYRKLVDIKEDPVTYLGSNALELILKYFSEFGEKNCCLKDLFPFLPLLKDEYTTFLSRAYSIIRVEKSDIPISKRQMMMLISFYQLKMYFGAFNEYSPEEKVNQVEEILRYYHQGHRYNINLMTTDIGYNDTFILLAGHLLYKLFIQIDDYVAIKVAICILEYGYARSSSNYHLKLLLLKLYNTIGAVTTAYKYYESLDIKHIQYESMGYLVLWTLLSSGQCSITKQLMDNTLKFFNVNYKETADQLTYAYKFGSFEKIIELSNFREKLKNSYHYMLVNVEQLFIEILQTSSHELSIQAMENSSNNSEKDLIVEWRTLYDNRDTNIFMCYDSQQRKLNEKHAKMSFQHDVYFLRIRSLMLRCVMACLNMEVHLLRCKSSGDVNGNITSDSSSNGIIGEEASIHLNAFLKLVNELSELYEELVNDTLEDLPKEIFSGIEKSRLLMYLRCQVFLPLFIDAMMFIHSFYSKSLIGDITEQEVEDKAELVARKFDELIQDCKKKIESETASSKYSTQSDTIQTLVLTSEMVCIMSIICGSLYSLLMKSRTSKSIITVRKKKKKGKDINSPSSSPVISVQSNEKSDASKRLSLAKIYRYFVTIVRDYIKVFHIHVGRLDSTWCVTDSEGITSKLRQSDSNNPLENISQERWQQLLSMVNDNVTHSYKNSIKEIRNVISQKIECISHLEM